MAPGMEDARSQFRRRWRRWLYQKIGDVAMAAARIQRLPRTYFMIGLSSSSERSGKQTGVFIMPVLVAPVPKFAAWCDQPFSARP